MILLLHVKTEQNKIDQKLPSLRELDLVTFHIMNDILYAPRYEEAFCLTLTLTLKAKNRLIKKGKRGYSSEVSRHCYHQIWKKVNHKDGKVRSLVTMNSMSAQQQ